MYKSCFPSCNIVLFSLQRHVWCCLRGFQCSFRREERGFCALWSCVCWSDRKPGLLSVNSTCKIYQVYYLTEVTLSLQANRPLPDNFFFLMEACAVKGKVSIDWLPQLTYTYRDHCVITSLSYINHQMLSSIMLMVSLKPPKPSKLKGRSKNAILSVIFTTCSSKDGRLEAGSTRLCHLQGLGLGQCLLAHTLVFPWQNICANIWLSLVFTAEEYATVITVTLYNSHVQEILNPITAWTFSENLRLPSWRSVLAFKIPICKK